MNRGGDSRRAARAVLACIALLAALVSPGVVGASGEPVITTRVVSGPSPFSTGCTDPGALIGAEVEPHVAANPADPDHLIAAWQQDRFQTGGAAQSDLVATSRDGGETWTASTIAGLSRCTGGERARATDPWTAIGPDGRMYLAAHAVSFSFVRKFPEPLRSEGTVNGDGDVVVASSDDGSAWQTVPVARDDGVYLEEAPRIAADPTDPGRAFVVWGRQLLPNPLDIWGRTDIWPAFSRTADGGRTWTAPIDLPNLPGLVEWPSGLVVIPDSAGPPTLIAIATIQSHTLLEPGIVVTYRSEDLGESWTLPIPVGPELNLIPVVDPETGDAVRACACLPSAAVAPDGALYVTWYEWTPVGRDTFGGTKIVVFRSDDRGRTWSRHVATRLPFRAFTPTIAVAGDGTVGVFWYEFRNDVADDDALTTDLRFAWSRDRGETWNDVHLAGPFDLRTAPRSGGYMVTDYEGLVGFEKGFGALFIMASPQAVDGQTDVFFSRIDLT